MYLLSQKGNEVSRLTDVWISATSATNWRIMHINANPNNAPDELATYPTEAEAKAQITGIAAAIRQGTPLYRFD